MKGQSWLLMIAGVIIVSFNQIINIGLGFVGWFVILLSAYSEWDMEK